MGHHQIEAEAKNVAAKKKLPRNVLTNPSPDIWPHMLVGILPDGRVTGYEKGVAHKGTFYAECEGLHLYPDESFLRVVMYGDEFHDKETRIPLAMLEAARFIQKASDSRYATLLKAAEGYIAALDAWENTNKAERKVKTAEAGLRAAIAQEKAQ